MCLNLKTGDLNTIIIPELSSNNTFFILQEEI